MMLPAAAPAYPRLPAEKPDIRLVAIDLDGTMLTGAKVILPRTKSAIQSARRQGVGVTIATGRMFRSAQPYARELEIDLPLITYQGAMIATTGGQVLHHYPMEQELCVALMEFLRPFGHHINVYIDDRLYIEENSPEAERYQAKINTPLSLVPDLRDLLAAGSVGATKFSLIAAAEQVAAVMTALAARFGSQVLLVPSEPTFLEIGRSDRGKGVALAELAADLGVRQDQVMAIGDSPNDLDMIDYAGWGVVMANGAPEVKAQARWITASNEEDGVALAIENLVLK